ncbi:UDP-N-acetylmuramoyl-L-alanine--D-glutamate ligase [Kiloniella sp. b19]|uniref:UDP-N-acetylmuramoyl-L-alanine--D-glutamate ligase n=1 Tax=Kiloniella sp. GXU_MW_B19 TaxID=3141326 RepID=UPI0031D140C3
MTDLRPYINHLKSRTPDGSACFYVVGLGRSGLASATALQAAEATVMVWDDQEKSRQAAAAKGFAVVAPESVEFKSLQAVVLAPGIPLTHPQPHPVVMQAQAAGIEVISDLEILYRAHALKGSDAPRFVGITGTNGKSTTTVLIAHLLSEAGMNVVCGGNLGTAVFELPDLSGDGVYVLELSSYQLDLCHQFRFNAALLLNMSPDHLDRHGDMEGYAKAKARIFNNQTTNDAAFVGLDDEHSRQIFDVLNSRKNQQVIPLSVTTRVAEGLFAVEGQLCDDRFAHRDAVLDLGELPTLVGQHNHQNALAAYGICRFLGLDIQTIEQGLQSFGGLVHRQELCLRTPVLRIINDSKATNVEATARALGSFSNIIWIAGGLAKEGGFTALKPLLHSVRKAFLIGEGAEQMNRELSDSLPATVMSRTLEQAVPAALAAAGELHQQTGECATVLLSPACASFDQFKSFEARGDHFKALVRESLKEKTKGDKA